MSAAPDSVQEGSSASKAGIRGTPKNGFTGEISFGNIIVQIDGKKVDKEADLYDALDGRKPGEAVTVTVLRIEPNDQPKEVELSVVLEAQEAM